MRFVDRFRPSRRSVIAAGALSVAAPTVWRQAFAQAGGRGKRVAVIGGGFGGAMSAGTLRRIAPELDVTLIDPAPAFLFAPASIDLVFGRTTLESISRSYKILADRGVRVMQAEAKAVDPAKRRIETDKGPVDYDAVVLATGIRLAPDEVEGLGAAENLSLYDRAKLPTLKQRIDTFQGGTIVVSVPTGALRCPPAPYEYALQLAHLIKAKKLKGRVVLLDAWPSPQPDPLEPGLNAALGALADTIEYVPQVKVERVDAKARTVHTAEGDSFEYDLLSLIPPNRATPLVAALGIAGDSDIFAEVDPLTFRSRKHDTVFAIGDVARTPYGRSAGAAAAAGVLCAQAIARILAGKPAAAKPTVETACYPMLAPDSALLLETGFAIEGPEGSARAVPKSQADNNGSAANLQKRRAWEKDLTAKIFG